MKLIDADEVKKYIHDLMLNNVNRYTDKEMTQYDNLIDSCRTVKAIPIEWLERKGMILAANKYDFSAGVIRIVIKEWEKENDKQ